MSETALGTRNDLAMQLILRAWKDPEFKKAIKNDPKKLLEERLGRKLPEELRIFVHEEDAQTMHFSIPPTPASVTELSEDDLEKVAGGTEITILIIGTAATAAAATGGIVTGAVVTANKGW